MATIELNANRLREQVESGTISRQEMLEEIEHGLDSNGGEPTGGALELLLEELHLEPANPKVLCLLARLYERDGHPQAAKRARQMAERAPKPNQLETEADVGIDAEAELHDQLCLGRVLLELGLTEKAADAVTGALERGPDNISALNLLAKIRHIQGRLTETIRLWWRIQELSQTTEAALAHLGILHQIAKDDEMVGKRFAAVGEGYFAPKHDYQIEIEKAFAKFKDRDFPAAISIAEELAQRTRGHNPPIFKLAKLQKAWFQERTGDLVGVRETLEQMGRERGFETDLDRIGYLARICERLNTPESREMALSIYEHLDKHHLKLSALPRIASLHKAQGNDEVAYEYAKEYERRFNKRMKRPTVCDYLTALSLEYVPLSLLPKLSFTEQDDALCELEIRLTEEAPLRRRRWALNLCLRQNWTEAASIFQELAEKEDSDYKDYAYLADILARQNDPVPAVELWTLALNQESQSSDLIWKRLSQVATEKNIDKSFNQISGGALDMVRNQFLDRAKQDPANPMFWEDLFEIERLLGRDKPAREHSEKAAALRAATARTVPDIGKVMVAARYALGGKPKGIIHEMLAGRRPVTGSGGMLFDNDIQGNLTEDLRSYTRLVFAAVKDYALFTWPHLCGDIDDYAYTLRLTKDDEPSSGSSAGLPTAIAFLSVFLQKPVPPNMTFTGQLNCDSIRELVIHRVGDVVFKIKGTCHRNLETIVLPADSKSEVDGTDIIPESVARSLVKYAANLHEAVELVWGEEAWFW